MAHLFLHTPNEQLNVWGAVLQLTSSCASPQPPAPLSSLSCWFSSAPIRPASLPALSPLRPHFPLYACSFHLITLLFSSLSLYWLFWWVFFSGLNRCGFTFHGFLIWNQEKKDKEIAFYYSMVFCWVPLPSPAPPAWFSSYCNFLNVVISDNIIVYLIAFLLPQENYWEGTGWHTSKGLDFSASVRTNLVLEVRNEILGWSVFEVIGTIGSFLQVYLPLLAGRQLFYLLRMLLCRWHLLWIKSLQKWRQEILLLSWAGLK